MDTSIVHGCIDFLEEYDKEHPYYKGDLDTWIQEFEVYTEDSLPCEEIEVKTCLEGVQDIVKLFLLKASSCRWGDIPVEIRKAKVTTLIDSLQVQQRTPEWFEQSKKMLTASEFSNILGTPRAMANLALLKVAPVRNSTSNQGCNTESMSAFDWGIRFEPIVKQVLQTMWSCVIKDVGRFVHNTDSKLAASPDGIIVDAVDASRVSRLLEIKCPISREINGKVPFEYWCQMQIQMEVTGIDECDYVEMKIASKYKTSTYTPPTEGLGLTYFGTIWLFQYFETCELKYAFTPIEKKDLEFLGWHCLEEIPWHLENYYTETVVRDPVWYEGTKPKQEEFWLRVADAHNGLIEPPKRRARTSSVNVCQIVDDLA
jgi:putative phage-type endonuclease